MGKVGRVEEQPSLLQVLKDLRVRILDEQAGKRCVRSHAALLIDALDKGHAVLRADAVVVFTEGSRDVDDAGTVLDGDIGIAHHVPALLLRGRDHRVQRLVLPVLQVGTLHALQDLVIASQIRLHQRFRHVVGIIALLHLHIVQVRVHAEADVGRKGPGCGGPCEEVSVLSLHLEADRRGALLDVLIALCHLVGGKRGPAARAVGDDLEALVQEPLVPDLLQRPPLGFDEGVVVGDIGIVHIRPEADGLGEILPHPFVLPDRLFALFDERLQTVLLDLLLAVQAEQLLDLDLHGQSVGVPAGLSRDLVALHGAVTRNHVLDDAGQDVADMRLSVGRRRSVVEHIGRTVLAVFDGLFENLLIIPEFLDFLLSPDKVEISRNFLVHVSLSSLKSAARGKKNRLPPMKDGSLDNILLRCTTCILTYVFP